MSKPFSSNYCHPFAAACAIIMIGPSNRSGKNYSGGPGEDFRSACINVMDLKKFQFHPFSHFMHQEKKLI